MGMSTPDPRALDHVANMALTRVEPHMRLGLGTGRAAEAFLRKLGERVAAGLVVLGVPTSERSASLARSLHIPLATFDDVETLDVAFDGADEVDPALDLAKGLGGAHLRERVVAAQARRFVVLVTPEKLSPALGTKAPVPLEIVPFALPTARRALARLGEPVLRMRDGAPFVTDNHNFILDLFTGPMSDPARLDAEVRRVPGVVDTGLFLGMATEVLVGEPDGARSLERAAG